jgi:hypothetical protein
MSKKSVKPTQVVPQVVKTPEERAAIHLEMLIEKAGWNIKSGDEAIAKFSAGLAKDPAREFEWSKEVFMAAARKQAASHVLAIIEHCKAKGDGIYTDGLPPMAMITTLRRELLAVVIRKARWPEHSTSPTHNYMHQCSLSATTEWLVQVDPSLGS